MNNGKK